MNGENSEAIEAWNTVLFDKFVRFRETILRGFVGFGEALLDRHPPPTGGRALDVGCGFGDTTLAIAKRVGPKGEAVGVDAAARFVESATRDAKEQGVTNARFVTADVQLDALGGPYDYAFSRFGTMFFSSAVAALRNVRRSMKPGATFTMAVWRKKDENALFDEAEKAVLAIVPHHEKKPEDVTCGPGPFSMASPDLVSTQLLAAGFRRCTFERCDAALRFGRDVDEALAFATMLGPAGEVIRLAGDEAARKADAIDRALRELLGKWARPDGVYAQASCWLVSAIAD